MSDQIGDNQDKMQNSEIEQQYQAALNLIQAQKYYQAIRLLDDLLARSDLESYREKVRAKRQEASVELERATEKKIQEAREVEQRFPRDPERQREAWLDVQEVNPDHEQVSPALERIAKLRERLQIELALEDVLKDAEGAVEYSKDEQGRSVVRSGNLGLIAELRGKIESWQEKQADFPPELQNRINEARRKVLDLQQKVRDALGRISTEAVQDVTEAYRDLRSLVESPAPPRMLHDAGNILGKGAVDVDTFELWEKLRSNTLAHLRNIATDRMSQAQGQKKDDPGLALESLRRAKAYLEADWLILDDRKALEKDRASVEREIAVVEKLKMDYNKAAAMMREALVKPPRERYKALIEAREIYPDHPRINVEIEMALDALGGLIATELNNQLILVQQQEGAWKYDEALRTLSQAVEAAAEQIPQPKSGSRLEEVLGQIRAYEQRLIGKRNRYLQTLEMVAQVQQALKEYETSRDSKHLTVAHVLFKQLDEQLDEQQRQAPEVMSLRALVTSLQGSAQNWADGQEKYSRFDWKAAEEYFKKVGDDFPKAAEARTLALRARAAQYEAEAAIEEERRSWRKALDLYKSAAGLFGEHGVDSYTAPVYDRCKEALERLKPIEENDRKARQLINEARNMLEVARMRLARRQSLRDRLDPVPELIEVVKKLEDLQKMELGSAADELTDVLSQARGMWVESYLPENLEASPFYQVLQAEDIYILTLARQRADELRSAGLLSQRSHRELYRQVLGCYLDAEWRTLRFPSSGQVRWDLIEQNRRELISILREMQPTDLTAGENLEQRLKLSLTQLQEAVRGRIQTKVSDLTSKEAQEYLAEQIARSDAGSDPFLVQLLIKLCWKNEDWETADLSAQRYSERYEKSAEFAKLWQGLTRAARFFVQSNIELGMAEIEQLKRHWSARPETVSLLQEVERELLESALQRLVTKAQQCERSEDYLQAAEYYALANLLDGENVVVRRSLESLGRRLTPGVQSRCSQAENLRIGNRSLDEALQESERLEKTLNNIYQVSSQLQLDEDTRARLEQSLEQLRAKKARWMAVKEQLDKMDAALSAALSKPLPLSPYEDGGGWKFEEARGYLMTAQDEIRRGGRKDVDLLRMVEERQARLERCEEAADRLMKLVQPLMEAVRAGRFDEIRQHANALETAWKDARRVDPSWGGLGDLLSYTYPPPYGEARTPQDHARIAEELNQNLRIWKDWAERLISAHKDVMAKAKELLGEPLDSLKQNKPLEEIIAESQEGIDACNRFYQLASEKPAAEPLSEQARDEARRVDAGQFRAAIEGEQGARARLQALKMQAVEQQQRLDTPLRQLQKAMKDLSGLRAKSKDGRVSQKVVDNTMELVRKCSEIDPMNPMVFRFKQQLKDIPTK